MGKTGFLQWLPRGEMGVQYHLILNKQNNWET